MNSEKSRLTGSEYMCNHRIVPLPPQINLLMVNLRFFLLQIAKKV